MIPFATTSEQKLKLVVIAAEMMKTNLDQKFIAAAYELARTDQGVYDLFDLWTSTADDPNERDQIIADIQDLLDDYRDAPQQPLHKAKIEFDELDDITQRILREKTSLRQLIDQHGGVSAVAHKAGIPQPSLSRMLNSVSMPRRSTLYKIANALDLPETAIAFEWTR